MIGVRTVRTIQSRPVLNQLLPTAASKAAAQNCTEGFLLENTPYTKCGLLQQTNRALNFIKTATEGEICRLILRFSHTAEYMAIQANIAKMEAKRAREAVKRVRSSKERPLTIGKGEFGWGDDWQGHFGWDAGT